MKSPAMLSILPLQDYLATDGEIRYQGNPADERINVPAIPRYYWRYRMHCTLESLIANEGLNKHIRTLVEAAGRNK
jgi:4-alpha-glucanotransferase